MIKSPLAAVLAFGLLGATVFAQSQPAPGQTRRPRRTAVRDQATSPTDTRIPREANSPVPQGWVNTSETKNDWEEINFEFNSSVISDGFPTLLWLADFLKANSGYRITVTGHTDYVGSDRYNERLGLARANTVKAFLIHYGASPAQIAANGEGKRRPEVENRTKEDRFVNRRVIIVVTDENGNRMSLEDLMAKKYKQPVQAANFPCCDEILKRLDNLAKLLGDLKANEDAEHQRLQNNIDNLKNQIAGLPSKDFVQQEGVKTAAAAAQQGFEKGVTNNRKFSLLGMNVGPTIGQGRFTFTGRGQFFSPFGNGQLPGALGTHAVQAQAEYMYYPGRQEGQFDIGLVNRWDRLQLGLFSSFKYVNFREFQSGATLGQGSFTFDYLFSRGRIGFFGAKGFKDNGVVSRQQLGPNSWIETYLRIVDQIGGSGQIGLFGSTYLEGNLGYLKRHAPGVKDRPGGTIRFVGPLSDRFALTLEAGLNETLLYRTGDVGSVKFGFEFGNWIRPKQYLATTQPVPVDIPRIRYELLTRRVGSSPPVANAGGDQINVPPGQKTLNGSGSYSPDGDPLTYQWTQTSGPSVTISNATSAVATFTAATGQTYVFQLTVKNPAGQQATDRATVSTKSGSDLKIVSFAANPPSVQPGQASTLTWEVQNADTVTISPGVGSVNKTNGSTSVSPTQTTTYTLTATGLGTSVSSQVTVTVSGGPQILRFDASPTNITPGEASTLTWATQGATQVTISGIGTVSPNGSTTVTPASTTTYTLTATNGSQSVSAPATVTVGAGGVPRILSFTATPTGVSPGGQSTLSWKVENATTVNISPGVGNVSPTGSSAVTPANTTTYTLTATNAQGSVTATAVVTVSPLAKIVNFTANPQQVQAGAAVTLTWTTTNATDAVITGIGPVPVNGSITVNPIANTIYTLIAYGANNQVSADALVTVSGGSPMCDAGPNQSTYANTVTLNGSKSFSPGGLSITDNWTFVSGPAAPAITGGNTASPSVLLTAYGEYIFQLTVTDSRGGTCQAFTRVSFLDP